MAGGQNRKNREPWKAARDRDKVNQILHKERTQRELLPLRKRDPNGEAVYAMDHLHRMGIGYVNHEQYGHVILIPRPVNEYQDIEIKALVKMLGYDFRRSKSNPVKVQKNGDVTIDAKKFLEKCMQRGWDCSLLIDQPGQTSLAQIQVAPEDRRLGPGGTNTSTPAL